MIMFRIVDFFWTNHIDTMSILKNEIITRGFGQQDPIAAYKKEGFEMFEGVCLIEWPDKMGGYLPRHAIKLKITPKEENRQIEITFAEEKTYQRFLALKD